MMKINKKAVLSFVLLFLFVVAPMALATYANGVVTGGGVNKPAGVEEDMRTVITRVINWILGFMAVIATLLLIWGGVQYLISQGDEAAIEKAKHTITYAVVGLIVIGLAYAIVLVVVNAFLTGTF